MVDALDERAVNQYVDAVAAKAGSIDIALNAVGIDHVQGTPFLELSLADFESPIHNFARTNFITAKAAARRMVKKGAGVILTLSTPGAVLPQPGVMGFGAACAVIETFTRKLAGELGPQGIRAVCLRPDAIPEAVPVSYSRGVFQGFADRAGITIEAMLAGHAAFMASDRAGAMTGAIANPTCGSLVD